MDVDKKKVKKENGVYVLYYEFSDVDPHIDKKESD